MRISDWSSDVCSSDLSREELSQATAENACARRKSSVIGGRSPESGKLSARNPRIAMFSVSGSPSTTRTGTFPLGLTARYSGDFCSFFIMFGTCVEYAAPVSRSEEHTSELQSLMRISYAVFCLKKKITHSKTLHRTSRNYSTK